MRSLAQRINPLEHMFQMTAIAQQTLLNLTNEVVNHPETLVLPDGTNLMGYGRFQFSNRFRTIVIHLFIQEPPKIENKIKICGVQIGWMQRPLWFATLAVISR